MKTMFKVMQKKANQIPADKLLIFEDIIHRHEPLTIPGTGEGCYREFTAAMENHLTREQRFRLFEQHGGCMGTGYDKARKAFAREHANIPLEEQLELYCDAFNRDKRRIVINDDNTITVTFACTHGYYKHAPKGNFHPPASLQTYFDSCAGGRLYELEKALGIKLKIKSVDISPLSQNVSNPVVFIFEILQ